MDKEKQREEAMAVLKELLMEDMPVEELFGKYDILSTVGNRYYDYLRYLERTCRVPPLYEEEIEIIVIRDPEQDKEDED